MTVRGLFRELAAAKLVAEDRAREATLLAFQINRMHCDSHSKRGMKTLKAYLEEIGSGKSSLPPPQSPLQARAALEMMAARMGRKLGSVKLIKTERGYQIEKVH